MTSMTLYAVTQEGMELNEILTEMDGELTPEMEERFDAFLKAGKEKVNAAVMVVRQLEANAQVCKDEAKRLSEKAGSWERQAEQLKHRILALVDLAFDGKVKTALFTIWGQTSAPTVAIDLAPDAALNAVKDAFPAIVRTKLELDKAAVKQMVADGEDIPAAVTVTENPGKRYLRIK